MGEGRETGTAGEAPASTPMPNAGTRFELSFREGPSPFPCARRSFDFPPEAAPAARSGSALRANLPCTLVPRPCRAYQDPVVSQVAEIRLHGGKVGMGVLFKAPATIACRRAAVRSALRRCAQAGQVSGQERYGQTRRQWHERMRCVAPTVSGATREAMLPLGHRRLRAALTLSAHAGPRRSPVRGDMCGRRPRNAAHEGQRHGTLMVPVSGSMVCQGWIINTAVPPCADEADTSSSGGQPMMLERNNEEVQSPSKNMAGQRCYAGS